MAAGADDVGKVKLGAICIVETLECCELGVGQLVKSGAVLLDAGFWRQASRALDLVGEVRMKLDQRTLLLNGHVPNDRGDCIEELLHACERPAGRDMIG